MSKRMMPSGGRSLKARQLAAKRSVLSSIRAQNARVTPLFSRGRLRRRNAITAGYLGVELKYQDMWYPYTVLSAPATPDNTVRVNPVTNQGTPAAPSNVSILSLNAVCQGDGPWNRDGKKIRLRSLYIKGTLFRPAISSTPTTPPITAYLACVLDKQPNAAEIAPAQVFVNPTGVDTGCGNWLRHLEYNDRYRILKDQVFTFPALLTPNGAPNFSTSGLLKHFEWFIPLNFDTLFNTTTPTAATVASIVTNAIGMIGAASASAGGYSVALTYNARLRFVG